MHPSPDVPQSEKRSQGLWDFFPRSEFLSIKGHLPFLVYNRLLLLFRYFWGMSTGQLFLVKTGSASMWTSLSLFFVSFFVCPSVFLSFKHPRTGQCKLLRVSTCSAKSFCLPFNEKHSLLQMMVKCVKQTFSELGKNDGKSKIAWELK